MRASFVATIIAAMAAPLALVTGLSIPEDALAKRTASGELNTREAAPEANSYLEHAAQLSRRGIAASQARLLMLNARKGDLENLMNILHSVNQSPEIIAEEAKIQVQLDAVNAELDSVQKVINENTEESFRIDP